MSGSQPQADRPDLPRLVRAAQAGDLIAMDELLGLLTPYVGRIAGPIALEHGADAAQEALIIIFRRLGQLQQPAALFSWARAIAVREAVRVARAAVGPASGAAPAAELPDLPARGDPQLATDIRDLLDRLSPEHRAVLLLRDVVGLDEASASRLLAVPKGTVKSRLARARADFRKAWQR